MKTLSFAIIIIKVAFNKVFKNLEIKQKVYYLPGGDRNVRFTVL